MSFELHPRLAAGSFSLGRFRGCRLLLKDQRLFPWFLLVPEVAPSIEDLHQLPADVFDEVTLAIREVSAAVATHFQPTKLNVAAIGNQVRQLHVHLVARREDDAAWPGTVWAHTGREPYEPGEAEAIVAAIRHALDLH